VWTTELKCSEQRWRWWERMNGDRKAETTETKCGKLVKFYGNRKNANFIYPSSNFHVIFICFVGAFPVEILVGVVDKNDVTNGNLEIL
jgi:hypothetical protein